eukprot:1077914-Rhodomonas_salina.2
MPHVRPGTTSRSNRGTAGPFQPHASLLPRVPLLPPPLQGHILLIAFPQHRPRRTQIQATTSAVQTVPRRRRFAFDFAAGDSSHLPLLPRLAPLRLSLRLVTSLASSQTPFS